MASVANRSTVWGERLELGRDDGGDIFFVVGFPRSGTKMVRDLLNRHPAISMPREETHCLPYLMKRFGRARQIGWCQSSKEQFLHVFNRTSFVSGMREHGFEPLKEGDLPPPCAELGWPVIFRSVLRKYGEAGMSGREDRPECRIMWGDKTPFYMCHINALQSAFPRAKFVHIVRDPRDVCVSQRRIWNKAVERTADRWARWCSAARRSGGALAGDRYIEVKYEDLARRPEEVLAGISKFLGVEPDAVSVELDRPSEDYGYAVGKTEVVASSIGHFVDRLTDKEIRRIEERAWPTMIEFGYRPSRGARFRELGVGYRGVLQVRDAVGAAAHHVRRRGLWRGLVNAARVKLQR